MQKTLYCLASSEPQANDILTHLRKSGFSPSEIIWGRVFAGRYGCLGLDRFKFAAQLRTTAIGEELELSLEYPRCGRLYGASCGAT